MPTDYATECDVCSHPADRHPINENRPESRAGIGVSFHCELCACAGAFDFRTGRIVYTQPADPARAE